MNATRDRTTVMADPPHLERSGLDRRAGDERRQMYDLNYFLERGGIERRERGDRRRNGEKRAGWVRVTQWSSICVQAPVAVPAAALGQ